MSGLARLLASCAFAFAGAAIGAADAADDRREPSRAGASPSEISDSSLNLRGVFNSELPGIGRKYQLKLILHPHLGDLAKYDYLRTALGLRYTLSSHLEVSGETNTTFGTGLRDVGFLGDPGLVDARLGFKYRLGRHVLRGWDAGAGATYTFPFGHPPAQLTDGFEHFRPFVTFARPLESHPEVRMFWKLGLDLLSPTDIVGEHEKNDLLDDSNSIGGGFVWDRGAMHYTFEVGYATTRLLGERNDDVFMIRPGFVWEVPHRFTRRSRGQWLFGVALTLSDGPDGFEVGIGGKLRLDLDLKRLWRRSLGSTTP
jgi:hypothetical protein